MSHRLVTKSQTALNMSLLVSPLLIVQARSSGGGSQVQTQTQAQIPVQMVVPPQIKIALNNGSPLIPPAPPNQWDVIPTFTLKDLPKFTGEDSKTPKETFQDVVDVCTIHNVM